MELEEERKARHGLEQRLFEQEKKIENLINHSMSVHISSASTQVMVYLNSHLLIDVGTSHVDWVDIFFFYSFLC